jgi:hypothetical protein
MRVSLSVLVVVLVAAKVVVLAVAKVVEAVRAVPVVEGFCLSLSSVMEVPST